MQACGRLATQTTSFVDEARRCEITERHMRRVYAKWKEDGVSALIHKARGHPGKRTIPKETIELVISFIREELSGYTPAHAKEVCAEELGITLSVPTIRKYMKAAGLQTCAYRTKKVSRQQRARKRSFGMMLQCDGSFHHWFGPNYPVCCLLVFIDDATNAIMARFAQEEEIVEFLTLLKSWIATYGIPESLYYEVSQRSKATAA